MSDDIVWGAEIMHNESGRPDWLDGYTRICFRDASGEEFGRTSRWTANEPFDCIDPVISFRLPAEHPHYATPWQPDPRTVHACAEHIANLPVCIKFGCTAKAIADELIEALLPDPDIAEARVILAKWRKKDEGDLEHHILAAIKRGRELEASK